MYALPANQHATTWGHFYWHGLTWIPALIIIYIVYKKFDETTYIFLYFHGAVNEVLEWICNVTTTLHWSCDYLSKLGIKLFHISRQYILTNIASVNGSPLFRYRANGSWLTELRICLGNMIAENTFIYIIPSLYGTVNLLLNHNGHSIAYP